MWVYRPGVEKPKRMLLTCDLVMASSRLRSGSRNWIFATSLAMAFTAAYFQPVKLPIAFAACERVVAERLGFKVY